jgi:hypothetical protein
LEEFFNPAEVKFEGWDDESAPDPDLTFGEALTSDGRLVIDWNDYIKDSARELVRVTDDGAGGGGPRSRMREVYLYQPDYNLSDPDDAISTFPGLAVDDAYRTAPSDPYGSINVTLSSNDGYNEAPFLPAPVYSNPPGALSS